LKHFSFLTPEIGWCGQDDGPLLTTTDAGRTWEPREHGIRTSSLGNAALSAVELIEPGYGFVAGGSGYILEYRDPEERGVQEVGGDRSHEELIVRHSEDHILVAGAGGFSDLLVYDVLGRLLHRVPAEKVRGGPVLVNVEAVSNGIVIVVEEESGRRWCGVVVE